jgi:hypothetical protein
MRRRLGDHAAVSWLGLHPQGIADRAKGSGRTEPELTLVESVALGGIGFMFVSVAGFVPWAFAGKALHHAVGEVGLYAARAAVFVGLSGVVLHRLVIGPGSLWRFYALFAVAFTTYSVGWVIGWMTLRGNVGSVVGLLLGTIVMGWLLVRAFDSRNELLKIVAVLFVLNALGYFAGGWVEGHVAAMRGDRFLGFAVTKQERMKVALLFWGVCYGLGFGAGLGLAFHCCQSRARALLSQRERTQEP